MRIPQVIMGVGLVVLVVLLFSVPQQRRATYNPDREVTVDGTVQEVQDFYCPVSGAEGTHLLVVTDRGIVQVHVAPKGFLRRHNWNFNKGDRVHVTGSKIVFEGHDAVVARTVSRDNLTLSFRKPDGKPLWAE